MPTDSSLYERLGGEDGIETAVDEFYDCVLADESLAPHFEGVDVDDLRAHQRAFLTAATGGPDEYDGADLRTAHAHLDIDEGDFAAVAGHLDDALRAVGADDPEVREVIEAVAGLEDQVLDR